MSESEVRELLGNMEDMDDLHCMDYRKKIVVDGVTLEHVETCGGYEGGGEEHWIVFKIGDQFWEIPGWYASYHGAELEVHRTFEVEPYEVTVTRYKKVEK